MTSPALGLVHGDGIAEAVTVLRDGGTVCISDGPHVALVMAARFVSAAALASFERATGAPSAVALGADLFDARGLALAEDTGTGFPRGVAVDVTADAMTAMSRAGRARTIRALAGGEDASRFASPGHVTPLRATPGNLLARVGVVEASVDLVALAGLGEAALIAYLLDDEGNTLAPPTGRSLQVEEIRTARLLAVGGLAHPEVTALFRESMSRLPAAVTVVTCYEQSLDAAGEYDRGAAPVGLVVSSMVSYSSTPPSVVFSVAEASRSYQWLTRSETFGVNVLASSQREEMSVFASRDADKFAKVAWEDRHGSPSLSHAQSHLHCRKIAQFVLGDHALIVGSIIAGDSRDVAPMVYYDRDFTWSLAREAGQDEVAG